MVYNIKLTELVIYNVSALIFKNFLRYRILLKKIFHEHLRKNIFIQIFCELFHSNLLKFVIILYIIKINEQIIFL